MERKLKYLYGELERHFNCVRKFDSSAPIESNFSLFRVSERPLNPEALTPFVVISVDDWALSQSDADFGERARKGIEIAAEILASAPVRDKSYQGTVYIDHDVRYAYQGPERRSGQDRRHSLGTADRQKSSAQPPEDRTDDERRKSQRRSIPQL